MKISIPHLQLFITSCGLLMDILGAWLVAWEVVSIFRGEKFISKFLEEFDTTQKTHPEESKEFKKWETEKYSRMKSGLIFLTLGFAFQFLSIWLPFLFS